MNINLLILLQQYQQILFDNYDEQKRTGIDETEQADTMLPIYALTDRDNL
jgi:hypothetical protein